MKIFEVISKKDKVTDTGAVAWLLKPPEGHWYVHIGTGSEIRTLAQNNFFHKILDIWGKDLGYSLEEMKCLVKKELGLFKESENKKTGEKFIIYESSRDWNKEKFSKVVDWILNTAAGTGTVLPRPEEN